MYARRYMINCRILEKNLRESDELFLRYNTFFYIISYFDIYIYNIKIDV